MVHWIILLDKVAIHLNDTHPALAIPELMCILIDLHGYHGKTLGCDSSNPLYNFCHTLMSEALETRVAEMMAKILPRHLQMIFEITIISRVCENFMSRLIWTLSVAFQLIEEDINVKRMGWLFVVGSHKVNGVAAPPPDLMALLLWLICTAFIRNVSPL